MAALTAVPVLFAVHLLSGTTPLSPQAALAVVAGDAGAPGDVVAVNVRMPRALVGLLVGGLLGAAGALLQALVRNPLASPDLTGVSQGAVAAVLCWLVWGPGAGGAVLPVVACAGGLAAAAIVRAATPGLRDDTGPAGGGGEQLVLIGVLVGGVLSSVSTLALLFSGERVTAALGWLLGSLELRDWSDLNLLLAYLPPVVLLTLVAVPLVAVLQLGPQTAASLGVPARTGAAVVLLAAVLATAAAVSIAGAVGFVGLVAPHVARRIAGADPRRAVPLAALLGALLLSLADLAARHVRIQLLPGLADVTTAAAAIPVGVFTALVGVPFLLLALRRTP